MCCGFLLLLKQSLTCPLVETHVHCICLYGMFEAYVGYYHYGFEMVSVDRSYTDMSGAYTTSSVQTVKLTNILQTSLVEGSFDLGQVLISKR